MHIELNIPASQAIHKLKEGNDKYLETLTGMGDVSK